MRPVLLVGSVPLESSTAVFELASAKLGALAKRLPDGETGVRSRWIAWQAEVFRRAEGLEPGESFERLPGYRVQRYRVKPGARVKFGALGYAQEALRSYEEFKRLRSAGTIRDGTRFQVALPSPLGVVNSYMDPEWVAAAWPAYEARLGEEIDEIAAGVPARDLAFQWDLAIEPIFILGHPDKLALFTVQAMCAALDRVSRHIPKDAELGLHLCFGDAGGKHSIAPKDLGLLVDFVNPLIAALEHPVAWIHMPVPPQDDYGRFLAPLQKLKLGPATEIYLGIVHRSDGMEGAARRLEAARRILPRFGIATDCGLGRLPRESIPELLDLHRKIAALP